MYKTAFEWHVLKFAARLISLPAEHPSRVLFIAQCARIGLDPDAARVPAAKGVVVAATSLSRSLGLLQPRGSPPLKIASPVALSNRTSYGPQNRRKFATLATMLTAVRGRWRCQLAVAAADADDKAGLAEAAPPAMLSPHALSMRARTQLRQAQADRQAADAKATGLCRDFYPLIEHRSVILYPGHYLFSDPREAACTRARLRLNRNSLGLSQFPTSDFRL